MTMLFLATTASVPVVAPRPEEEPMWLELRRCEDDGGAVLPNAPRSAGKARSATSPDLDRAAA